jgi:hypothetical protein
VPGGRLLPLAAFLAAFGVYGALTGRQPPRGDSIPMWEVAQSIVRDQTVEAQTQWNLARGADGKVYALLPLLTSLVHVPGAAAYELATFLWPGKDTELLALPLAVRLGPTILGALTVMMFFSLARRFAGLQAATFTTAVVAVCTGVVVYSRVAYSEILQVCCFTGYILGTLRFLDDPTSSRARRLALWAGLLINAKLIYALAIPGVAAVVVWRLRREPRRLVACLAWAALVLALCAVPILWYNWVRFGGVLSTGYGPTGRGVLWRGLWGLLASPGKSVFLFNPPLLLALFGLPAIYRRHPQFVVALLAAALPVFLFYAQFMYWDGDWAWGPRYMTYMVPALCVGLLPIVEAAMQRGRLLRASVVAAFAAAGLWVQIAGCTFYWDHWIQIAKTGWLPYPRCPPPPPPEGGCWPDGKLLYAMHWVPALSQLTGHLWLLRHRPFGHTLALAERDAPYQWEGRVHLEGDWGYDRAVIDWWPIVEWRAKPRAAALGVTALLGIAALGVGLGAAARRKDGA